MHLTVEAKGEKRDAKLVAQRAARKAFAKVVGLDMQLVGEMVGMWVF